MSHAISHLLPPIPWLIAFLVAGIFVGWLYFRMLRASVDLLVEGKRAGMALLLFVARFGLIAGGLILAALSGAGPLIAMALGLWIGRALVMWADARRTP